MINKKIPMRMCIACKENKPKKELLRVVKQDDNFVLDYTGKLNGRGSYICNCDDCFNKLIKNKLLNKAYKQNIPSEVYESIGVEYAKHK